MSKNSIKHFKNIIAWQKAREIRNIVYQFIKTLPVSEKYNLTQQMKRAACSVTSNIAEGYGRFHFQENTQFCRQARGSLYELQDHITTCNDLNFINNNFFQELNNKITEAIKILDGYIRFLTKQKDDTN